MKQSNGLLRFQQRQPKQRKNKTARIYCTADFETTTVEDDCRVWAWGYATLNEPDYVEEGTDIDSFMARIAQENSNCYFHNLKFDGRFMLDWLLKHGYRHVVSNKGIYPGTFKTLISDMGMFYSITVRWHNGNNTEFRDSLKKIPNSSVARIAKTFNLPMSKGDIDYHAPRAIGHKLTSEESDYLHRDVSIVAHAMGQIIDSGMTKLTIASDSMAEYKRLVGGKFFTRMFPVLSEMMDAEIRRAYRGGFTFADKRFRGRRVGGGLVLDVNSLYPAMMLNRLLPYGEPEYCEGKVEATDSRPLVIFSVTFTARIKPDHIACIQIKGSSIFTATEYLEKIDEPVTLMVSNIDWALYNDHYDITVLAYGGGWRFHATQGMFDTYIDKWSQVKMASTGGRREIAKLHLNSLYGKFASNPNVTSKIPVLKDGVVKLIRGADEKRSPVYTAVGVFITSFARDFTIRAAQQSYATFAYADTDSLHLLTDTVPAAIEQHQTRIGAWKLEYMFDDAYYIRPKAYLERLAPEHIKTVSNETPNRFVTHIAGLPEKVASTLTFDDLTPGRILHGKLTPKAVVGGVVLKDIPFELKL